MNVKFECTPVKLIYNSDNYRIYGCDVDTKKYPNIKLNKWFNVTIVGDCGELTLNMPYDIEAEEKQDKYGFQYSIKYIKQQKPMSESGLREFLLGCGLSYSQSDEIIREYPNIIELVVNNQTDQIDTNKLYNIGAYRIKVIIERIQNNFMLAELVERCGGYFSFNIIKKLFDEYGSAEKIIEQLENNPYQCLCSISRIGFKTADATLLTLENKINTDIKEGKEPPFKFNNELRTSKDRCISALEWLLDENETNGNTILDIKTVGNELKKLVPECLNHFIDICKTANSDENISKIIYVDLENKWVAKSKTHSKEKLCAEMISQALYNPIKWNIDIEKYRCNGNITLTNEQLNTLQMVCDNTISVLSGYAGCVDCDTEFFNGVEWKRIADYKQGDKVLQYTKEGNAELVAPEQYHKYPCNQLWHFQTKYGIDQCLSEEHNVIYECKGKLYKTSMADMMFRQKHNKTGFTGRFRTTFNYDKQGIALSDNEIRLMVAVIADGSFYSTSHSNRCRVHLKKERKKQRLVMLLQNCNISYDVHNSANEGYTDYYFYAPLRLKFYPTDWYNCTNEQYKIIVDEYKYWDGNYETKGNRLPSYSTTNKSDADFMQFAFAVCGLRSVIRVNNRTGQQYNTNNKEYTRKSVEYSVSPTTRNTVRLNNDPRPNHKQTEFTPYQTKDGYKYCFTVPSHMLVLRRNNRIFVTGNSGKSASIISLIQMLKDNNKSFLLLAPTGRASKVLSGYTGCHAQTIHKLLFGMGNSQQEELLCDMVIIDESSMMDLSLFYNLLSFINLSRTKILLVGDPAQLPSVSEGNVLHDLINSNKVAINSLTKVFRYGNNSILTVATDIRNAKPYLNKPLGDNSYTFIETPQETMINKVKTLYKTLLDKGYDKEDILILSAYNKGNYGTVAINNMLQPIVNKNVDDENKYITVKNGTDKEGDNTKYCIDDLVIQTKNNYKAKVCDEEYKPLFDNSGFGYKTTFIPNGETGIIKHIDKNLMYIAFNDEIVMYDKSEINNIKLAYSISVHKSQGGSAKIIILLSPKSHTFMLNSNLLYVGITRSSGRVFHFGTPNTINTAIKKKADMNRQTWLKEYIIDFYDTFTNKQNNII